MLAREPFGVARVGRGEHDGACGAHGFGASVVDVGGCVEPDAGVVFSRSRGSADGRPAG